MFISKYFYLFKFLPKILEVLNIYLVILFLFSVTPNFIFKSSTYYFKLLFLSLSLNVFSWVF